MKHIVEITTSQSTEVLLRETLELTVNDEDRYNDLKQSSLKRLQQERIIQRLQNLGLQDEDFELPDPEANAAARKEYEKHVAAAGEDKYQREVGAAADIMAYYHIASTRMIDFMFTVVKHNILRNLTTLRAQIEAHLDHNGGKSKSSSLSINDM